MRIATTRAGEPVEELAARVYRFEEKPSPTALKSAATTLRNANPFLRRLSEVPEGTAVVVPDLETEAPARGTRRLEAASSELVVARLREAAAQAIELLSAELDDELGDARDSLEVLRSSETRRVTRADDEARRLREETEGAIKERMAAAERLGDYRQQVAEQVERDLDELLETLRAAGGSLAACASRVNSRQVDRDHEEQASRPPVDGIEGQRLLVTDDVADQPDEEPEQRHVPPPGRRVDRNLRGASALSPRGNRTAMSSATRTRLFRGRTRRRDAR